MAVKTSKITTAKKSASKPGAVATLPDPADSEQAKILAKMAIKPSVHAAAVIVEYGKPFGEQDLLATINVLSADMEQVWAGDLKRCEAMLFAQAHALQSIFMNFSRRALNQEYQKNLESFLRMGLKAQNQCRMTLETLATIKNPPVVFTKQANINNGGQQQVNNGVQQMDSLAPAAKSVLAPTELLEESDGQRLDTRAARTTSGAHPNMETVGEGDRPAKR